MLGSAASVLQFITVNEQSESNLDCNFHSSITSFASGRSYHQNLIVPTPGNFSIEICSGLNRISAKYSVNYVDCANIYDNLCINNTTKYNEPRGIDEMFVIATILTKRYVYLLVSPPL